MVEMKEFQEKTRDKGVEVGVSLEEPYARFIKEREGIISIFYGATVIG
jgi:hypothetical protein